MKGHLLLFLFTVPYFCYPMYDDWHQNNRNEALIGAIKNKDRAEVQTLLAAKANPSKIKLRYSIESPSYLAAENGSEEILNILIAYGADINEGDETPVHQAVRAGNQSAMKLLVQYRADINKLSKWGRSPLEVAIKAGQFGLVGDLVRIHGVRLPLGLSKEACLLHAAVCHEKDIGACVNLLRSNFISPNIPGFDDARPLHVAAKHNNLKACAVLRGVGICASLDIPDIWGNTPLHYAAECDDAAVYDFLREEGARTDFPNDAGLTPYNVMQQRLSEEACRVVVAADCRKRHCEPDEIIARQQEAITKLRDLVARGALLNRPPKETRHGQDFERQPLGPAVCYGLYDVVEWLLEHGADPNAPSGTHGERPLGRAAQLNEMGNHIKIAKLLLFYGADVESPDKHGHTALMEACEFGHEPMVRLLLEHNANPHRRQPAFNKTPLWQAVRGNRNAPEGNHVAIIKILLDLKVDPNVPTQEGETPLQRARQHKFVQAEQLLLAAKADPAQQIMPLTVTCNMSENSADDEEKS